MLRKLVTAKEIAKRAGLSYAVINNYTDMGLLDISVKKNRMRMYDFERSIERLAMISKLINEGYTLRVIAKILR